MLHEKYRNYTFLVYPESMPDDFCDLLAGSDARGFYILHDCDSLDDGTHKKDHYHVMLMYDNQRSINTVRKFATLCGACNGFVEPVRNAVGMARYLCHMDNINKHQYDMREVGCFGGTDYQSFVETKSERKRARLDCVYKMLAYISDNHIYSYSDFLDIVRSTCHDDWLESLMSPAVCRMIIEYIKSKTWTDNNLQSK